jgi:signal transduction histidine kinase
VGSLVKLTIMMKVMVAVKHDVARERIVEALGELTNVLVHEARGDLRAALHTLAASAPDLIVACDGGGVELIEAARRHAASPEVVIVGDEDTKEAQRRWRDAGAALYLHNEDREELTRGVRALALGRRAARRARAGSGGEAGSEDRWPMIGRIAGGAAHDIANYLAVADLSLAIIDRRFADVGMRMEILRARGAVDAAVEVARLVVAWARGGEPEPELVDLGACTREVIDLLKRAVPEHVRVVMEIERVLPPVRGVVVELQQLVMNLVLNACDAMVDGGTLRVLVRATAPGVVTLEVIDSGMGMANEPTDPGGGSPLTRSSKAGRHGQGLGLGIVRAVVERHGGIFRMGPTSERGTRVAVTLFAAS